MEYVDHPSFHEPGAEAILDTPFPKPKQGGLGEDESRCFLAYNLARKFGRKELAAKWEDVIVRANWGLCGKVATRSKAIGIDRDERLGECLFILLRCLRAFDVSLGFRFSTLATTSMFRRMTQIKQKNEHPMRIPRHMIVRPSFPLTDHRQRSRSSMNDIEMVREAIATLDHRMRFVSVARFLEERTLEDIAKAIGRSTTRVEQIAEKAAELIRQEIERN